MCICRTTGGARGLALLSFVFFAAPLQANLLYVQLDVEYSQNTAAGATLSNNGYEATALYNQSAGEFTSATLTYPGPGSPATLLASGTVPGTVLGSFNTLAAYQAAFPFGTYTFNFANGPTMATESLNYTQNLYPSAVPALTSASFNSLYAGINTANDFTVDFNGFTPSAMSSASFVNFSVHNSLGVTVFQESLPGNATGVVITASTLLPGTRYSFFLSYSNQIVTTDSTTHTGLNLIWVWLL